MPFSEILLFLDLTIIPPKLSFKEEMTSSYPKYLYLGEMKKRAPEEAPIFIMMMLFSVNILPMMLKSGIYSPPRSPV